jgi:CarD family transcriptional regulator
MLEYFLVRKGTECSIIDERQARVFNVGDMAVYPAHGVGKIESIEQRQVGDKQQSFYVMKILDSSMVIMIPTASCQNVGLRNIISSQDVSKIYDILNEKDVQFVTQPWNQRYREYMEKIKTGSVYEIASVLRDLFLLRVNKDLSFGERKMMDTAKSLLVKEIALANEFNETEMQVEKNIEQIFS